MKKDRDCKSCHSGEETPILTFPLQEGRDDRLLSRKRERIEVRVGRNPVNENIPRNAGQNLTAFLIKPLDSGLRRNDEIGSLRRAERAAVPPNMPM
jgi:hypothetical protein